MYDATLISDTLHNADIIIDTSFNVKRLLTQSLESSGNNQFLQGGLLLGILAWVAVQLKGIPIAIWKRIDRIIRYTVYFDDTNDFYRAFTKWYSEKYPNKFRNVNVKLRAQVKQDDYYRAPTKNQKFNLIISQYTDFNIFRYKGRMLFISKSRREFQNANNFSTAYLDSYSVYGFFARKALNALMQEIKLYRETMYQDNTNIQIHYNAYSSDWEEKEFTTFKSFDQLFMASKVDLLNDLNKFKSHRERYRNLRMPFKRGYLFYGPPGNGKTSLVIAMAEHLKMDLYIVNLSSISDDIAFIRLISEVPPNSVILFEDIDTYVLDRFGEKDNTKVSFSALLNTLNGIYEPQDAIIAITTNNIAALDTALIRPGRIDKKIHITNPSFNEALEFMESFYGIKYEGPLRFLIPETSEVSMADVQNICIAGLNKPETDNITSSLITLKELVTKQFLGIQES